MSCTVGGSPCPDKELTKSDIFGCDDVQIEKVVVPEWKGHVYVRGLSGTERDRFEESQSRVDKRGQRLPRYENFRARLCALCLCDSKGERMCIAADTKDIGKKNGAALARIFDVACRLSGMSEQDVEDMVGNSDDDPSDDSGYD